MKIFDISLPISNKMVVWPGSPVPQFASISSTKKGDVANDTKLTMGVHTGTHIDAPLHFIAGGKSIDKLPLEMFIGPTFVVYLKKVKKIAEQDLENSNLPSGVTRLLFKTSNSSLWGKGVSKFQKNYVGLTADAAHWLVKRRIKLVGVDYLSVARFDEAVEVHQVLLGKGVALLEGINLNAVKRGLYQLICLPVKISNLEAAPARAILLKL